MAQTKYTYSMVGDTPNGVAELASLKSEYESSPIITALDYMSLFGDILDIFTKDELSVTDQNILNTLVSNHAGIYRDDEPTEVIVKSEPLQQPFSSKQLIDGKKLYSRVTGKSFYVVTGTNTLEYTITHSQVKFNELEILCGDLGETVNLKILDTSTGAYSTIPNYMFNQFGFDVNIAKDYYHRASSYDADLYVGMRIVIEYTSLSNKNICINYIIHEVKD